MNYGTHVDRPDDSHWWDTWSDMFQMSFRTEVSSLNDDNREDEKEIEILEAASKIDDTRVKEYNDMYEEYRQLHLDAMRSGNKQLAEHYR
jgi:hypothetical protein